MLIVKSILFLEMFFNDDNGLLDGTVDGVGIAEIDGQPLYITLLDNGAFVKDVAVNPDGSYELAGVVPGIYTAQINDPAASPGLPAGWINTGETIGATGNDGSVNGVQTITVVDSDIVDVNFGIEKIPFSNDFPEPAQLNPGGTTQVAVPILTGLDWEDGILGGTNNLVILSLPNDAVLYYNGSPVIQGQLIEKYNPLLLTIDPIDGNVIPVFTYSFVDAAGEQSTPATVTMPFQLSLPIELIEFSVVKQGNTVELKWLTARELDNDYYIIERSQNGIDFQEIHKVKGQGTTDFITTYRFTDLKARNGNNYYRLKQIDHNLNFSYSSIESVYFDNRPKRSNLS